MFFSALHGSKNPGLVLRPLCPYTVALRGVAHEGTGTEGVSLELGEVRQAERSVVTSTRTGQMHLSERNASLASALLELYYRYRFCYVRRRVIESNIKFN